MMMMMIFTLKGTVMKCNPVAGVKCYKKQGSQPEQNVTFPATDNWNVVWLFFHSLHTPTGLGKLLAVWIKSNTLNANSHLYMNLIFFYFTHTFLLSVHPATSKIARTKRMMWIKLGITGVMKYHRVN
jgi:hypothetical protein